MSRTAAYSLLGLVLVLVSIPFAFLIGPFVIGLVLLVVGLRRAHRGFADGSTLPEFAV